jgi:hypothetical protein
VFPIITDHVRVADYLRLQRRFRANLKPHLLPFLVPWGVHHATPEERSELLAAAGWRTRAPRSSSAESGSR